MGKFQGGFCQRAVNVTTAIGEENTEIQDEL